MNAKQFLSAAFILVAICVGPFSPAQDADANRERAIVDKFMDVLLRRPTAGTALDRVYGYHVQAGTLSDVMTKLESEADASSDTSPDTAGAKYMLLGLLHRQRGDEADAAKALTSAAELRPDDAGVRLELGKALIAVGRGGTAAEMLEAAASCRADRVMTMAIYTELGRLYARTQQRDKALDVWQRLEKAFPGDDRVVEQIARTLSTDGQNEAALQRFESLIQSTSDADANRAIGYRIAAAELKRKLGRNDEAVADLEAVVAKLRPGSWLHSDARSRIEAGFLQSGDYAALADYYAGQVKANPDQLDLRMRLGNTLAKAGRLNEAETVLKDAVTIAGDDDGPRLALTDLLQSSGKYAAAAAQLQAMVDRNPENPDYVVRLGNLLLQDSEEPLTKRRAKAADAWRTLAESRKDDAVMTAQVADLMRRVERTDEALALYRRAIEISPDEPQYREYLGQYLHRLDRPDEAAEVWHAIAAEPRRTRENLVRLAEILNQFDRPAEALDAFAEAAEMDPPLVERLRFATLLADGQRYDDALLQVDAAEKSAETPDDREQVFIARIDIYSRSGTLNDRITEAQSAAAESTSAEDHRKLAMLLSAATRIDDAVLAIEKAKALDSDNLQVLEIAADLYPKASRNTDAIAVLQRLATLDVRYQSEYLKRIVDLQLALGLVDEALATAQRLIDNQPANPDSYRFYAEKCFRVGRDDVGIDTLRRALKVAPRDKDAKRTLASALETRFRTDEAIELYWQVLDDDDDLSDKTTTVKQLASLYDRKGDFDRLIERLENRGRESMDNRTTMLLTAAALESVGDIGAAGRVLETLLAENARDVELLVRMVDLSVASDDMDAAIEYQRQITTLADTKENQGRLVSLLIDGGQMDRAEAAVNSFASLGDPLTMIETIDRTISKGEYESAERFCDALLAKDDDLWEVRVRRATVLTQQNKFDDATKELDRIMALELPDETLSITQKKKAARTVDVDGVQRTMTQGSMLNQRAIFAQSSMYPLASFFKIGNYANMYYGGRQQTAIDPQDVGQAKLIATAMRMVAENHAGVTTTIDRIEKYLSSDPNNDSADKLIEANFVRQFAKSFDRGQPFGASSDEADLHWRLARCEPELAKQAVLQVVQNRQNARQVAARRDTPADAASIAPIPPLTEEQLELLREVYLSSTRKSEGKLNPVSGDPRFYSYSAPYYRELVESGHDAEAAELLAVVELRPDSIKAASATIAFLAQIEQDEKIQLVLDHVAENIQVLSTNQPSADVVQASSFFISMGGRKSMPLESRLQAIELGLACMACDAGNRSGTRSRSSAGSSSSPGILSTYTQVDGNYRQVSLEVPLSDQGLSTQTWSSLYQTDLFDSESEHAAAAAEHFSNPYSIAGLDADVDQQRQRLRQTIDAYRLWWNDKPEQAFAAIDAIGKANPDDPNWKIEKARLAAELNRPSAALAAIDEVQPMNQSMLQMRELAALNLASRLGRVERVKEAATKLFGMRLDKETELVLADQLTRLKMHDMARAILERSRRRGGQDARELMTLAAAMATANDDEGAAEVAFDVLRKLGRTADRNDQYYRGQAVRYLAKAKRLEPLLEQAERRVESSPKSFTLRTELAALYTAAGEKEKADATMAAMAEMEPESERTLLMLADQLAQSGKGNEAIEKYVELIKRDPKLIDRISNNLSRAAREATNLDDIYKELMNVNFRGVDGYRLGSLMNLNRYSRDSRTIGKNQRAFIGKILTETPANELPDLLLHLDNGSVLAKTEGAAKAVEKIFADDDTFSRTGNLWQRGSYSPGGVYNGALSFCLQTLREQELLRSTVLSELSERIEDDEKANNSTAKLLRAQIEFDASSNKSSENFKGVKQDYEQAVRDILDAEGETISQKLWWQLAGYLKSTERTDVSHDCPKLVVAILEHAAEHDDGSMRSDYRYSVHAGLSRAYQDAEMFDDAAGALMRDFREVLKSPGDQYNPGYAESQFLESLNTIASELLSCDRPLESIEVSATALASEDKFEAAKQWGGRSMTPERFTERIKTAVARVDAEDAKTFLERFVSSINDKAFSQTLVSLPQDDETPVVESSLAALMVDRLAGSDEGVVKLRQIDESLAKTVSSQTDRVTPMGLRALLGMALRTDDCVARIGSLSELIDTASEEEVVPSVLFDLQSPIVVGLQSDDADVKKAAAKVANGLLNQATRSERTEIAKRLLLATLRSNAGSDGNLQTAKANELRLKALLDQVAPASTPRKPVSSSVADTCLAIAEAAIVGNSYGVASMAVDRCFGGGVPLRNVDLSPSGSNGLFSRTRNRSISPSTAQSVPDNLDKQMGRAYAILATMRDGIGDDANAWDALFNTLRTIVLSDNSEGEVSVHAIDLFDDEGGGSSYRRTRTEPITDPPSFAKYLAVAAVRSGNADALLETLAERKWADGHGYLRHFIELQVAIERDDETAIEASLNGMHSMIRDAQKMSDVFPYTDDSDPQSVRVAGNVMLHALMQMRDRGVNTDLVQEFSAKLLHLARIDATLRLPLEIWRDLAVRAIESDDYDDVMVSTIADDFLACVSASYARYQASIGDRETDAERSALADIALRFNRMKMAGNWARASVPKDFDSNRWNKAFFSPTDLVQAEETLQYEFLSTMMIGDEGVRSMGTFMTFAEPPSGFASQLPRLAPARAVPVVSEDFPLCSSADWIAKVAAATGQTDAWIERLSPLIEKPGDDIDAMVAMALLADERLDEAGEVIDRVAKRLVETQPDKNTNDPLPLESMAVVIAGLEHETLRERCVATIPAVLDHGRRRSTGQSMQYFNRVAMLHQPLADSPPLAKGSPLKHWVAVQQPYSQIPVTGDREAYFGVDSAGKLTAVGGVDQNLLMLKYPVEGEFAFSFRCVRRGWGDADASYGAATFQNRLYNNTAVYKAFVARKQAEFKFTSPKANGKGDDLEQLDVTEDRVVYSVNGAAAMVDRRTSVYPFVGLVFNPSAICTVHNISITGNPTIPRSVSLLSPDLRGWSCPIVSGRLVESYLATEGAKLQAVSPSRQYTDDALTSQFSWFIASDGTLRSGNDNTGYGPDQQRHLQYQRPLLDGETFSYAFRYQPDQSNVHPSMGRVALVFSSEGLTLRWLKQTYSLESDDQTATMELPVDEVLADVAAILKPDSMNEMQLRLVGDKCEAILNGTAIARFTVATDRRPGLLGLKRQRCEVQDVTLSGDWPERLPSDLMER